MAKHYIDICLQPIPKSKLSHYSKGTRTIGKLLIKHGALSSRDYTADDKNATKLSFPKKIKMKAGEILIFAVAEFKSKSHRDKVFKAMGNDPVFQKMFSQPNMIDQKRAVVGGFSLLVEVNKKN